MFRQFNVIYDGKNDRYEIEYQNEDSIQLVCVGGRAMAELTNSSKINGSKQQDIGTAIFEYLASKDMVSLKDNPIFILPEIDVGVVKNALAINSELLAICQKYLAE